MQILVHILGQEIAVECAPREQMRLQDLAAALDARLVGFTGDAAGMKRLALAALSLLDEAQAAGAALARARSEIERLNDLVAEARLDAPPADERGRLSALRAM